MSRTGAAPDLILAGGVVCDGGGGEPRAADVVVSAGRIADVVGSREWDAAAPVRDVAGLVVAPGFIDIHSHSDITMLRDPRNEPKVSQGITLELLGQDGFGYAPVPDAEVMATLRDLLRAWNGDPPEVGWEWRSVADYLERFERTVATNAAYLVPHGTLRLAAVGMDDRPAAPDELRRMEDMLDRGMEDGAFGLSAGLSYVPGVYGTTDELVALCRVVARHGGFFSPHHRSYGEGAMEAYQECIEVADRSGVDLHLTHAVLTDGSVRGRAAEVLEMVEMARSRGLSVTLDVYPYTAGSTFLHVYLPRWAGRGGPEEVVARLADPDSIARLRDEMSGRDWDQIVLASAASDEYRPRLGQTIEEIAAVTGRPPLDAYVGILIRERLGATCLRHSMSEDDLRTFLCYPHTMACSDGILMGEQPHPRGRGAFPRFLARYVREQGVLSLAECVHKMTGLPAARLGLARRGRLLPGYAADIVCFDAGAIADRATFEEPRRNATGVRHLLVNGGFVVEDGRHTGATPGRAVRRDPTGGEAGSG